MEAYMTQVMLFQNWTIVGLGFAVALWAWRVRCAHRTPMPDPVLIRADLAQRERHPRLRKGRSPGGV